MRSFRVPKRSASPRRRTASRKHSVSLFLDLPMNPQQKPYRVYQYKTRIVVAGNWRNAKYCSWTTNRPPKRQPAIKDKQMLSLYACIRSWEKLDLSLGLLAEERGLCPQEITVHKSRLFVEFRGIEPTKRDPISLRTSSP